VVKIQDEFFPDGFGIVPESTVKSDLAATSLVFIIDSLHLKFFQDADHVKSGLGIDLVNKARDEYINGYHKEFLPVRDKDIKISSCPF
jgi:hypothetical protein